MAFNPSGFFGAVGRAASNVKGAFTGGPSKKKKRKVSAQTLSDAQGFQMTPEADTGANFAQAGGQERTATPYTGIRKRKKRPIYERKKLSTPKRKRYGSVSDGFGMDSPEPSLW